MQPDQDITSQVEVARRRFLVEGARSYVAANTALRNFQEEVRQKSQAVLQERLRDYENALGKSLKSEDIEPWVPRDSSWNNYSRWGVGLGVKFKLVLKGDPNFTGYCGLTWWDDQGRESPCFGVHNGVAFSQDKYAEELYAAFNTLSVPDLGRDNKNVWACKELRPEEAGEFDKRLADLLEHWIKAWKSIGGLKRIGL